MVYPTLLAAIGDVAHPVWRARAVWVVAGLTALSGLVVAVRMHETHHPPAGIQPEEGVGG